MSSDENKEIKSDEKIGQEKKESVVPKEKKPEIELDIPDSYWETYFKNINNSYMEEVISIAKSEKYPFEVLDDDGIVVETYEKPRKKLPTKHYRELENLRSQLAQEKNKDRSQNVLIDIYEKSAYYYFGLPKEKFEMTDWEKSKKLCDAANFVTLYGRPK